MKIHKYYRRHETVDPQGKNFDNKRRPSKGYIMWKMMGGDSGHSWSKSLEDKAKSLDKAECPCNVKTERLQKSNDYLNDIMRMIKFGSFLEKEPKKKPKKKPKPRSGTEPSGTWMANCKYNARKLSVSDKGNPFTRGRKIVRNEGAWCAELWRNPGKYDQQYKRPDGTTGRTSGMKLRDAVGRPSWKPVDKPPAR